jgi:hypothetical protein
MNTVIEQLEARLAELRGQRDGLLAARTKEATAEAARTFLEGARARSKGMGGLVVGGHGTGQPLDDVLRAFLLSDPRLEGFLVEEAQRFAELTEKTKAAKLRKIGGEIAAAEQELLAARKREALEEVERQFAGEAA